MVKGNCFRILFLFLNLLLNDFKHLFSHNQKSKIKGKLRYYFSFATNCQDVFNIICSVMKHGAIVLLLCCHCIKNEVFHKGFLFAADLVTFAEEILNGKLHFFCSVCIFRNCWNCCFLFSVPLYIPNWTSLSNHIPYIKYYKQNIIKCLFHPRKGILESNSRMCFKVILKAASLKLSEEGFSGIAQESFGSGFHCSGTGANFCVEIFFEIYSLKLYQQRELSGKVLIMGFCLYFVYQCKDDRKTRLKKVLV